MFKTKRILPFVLAFAAAVLPAVSATEANSPEKVQYYDFDNTKPSSSTITNNEKFKAYDVYGTTMYHANDQVSKTVNVNFGKDVNLTDLPGNSYIVTEFDMAYQSNNGTAVRILLRNSAYKNLFDIRCESSRIFLNGSKNKFNLTDSTENMHRIRLVWHVKDKDGNLVNKASALYVDGTNYLDADGIGAANGTNDYHQIQITTRPPDGAAEYSAPVWLDNFSVATYTSADGMLPIGEKRELLAALNRLSEIKAKCGDNQEYAEIKASISDSMRQPLEVFKNAVASQAEVDAAAGNADAVIKEIVRQEFRLGFDVSNITGNIELPVEFYSALTGLTIDVRWQSSSPYITADGTVIRTGSDEHVTLTATLSSDAAGFTVTKDINATVKANDKLYSVTGISFADGSGNAAAVPHAGGMLKSVSIIDRDTSGKGAWVIAAIYDKSEKTLIQCKLIDLGKIDTIVNEINSINVDMPLPGESVSNTVIRIFIFDSLSEIHPLDNKFEYITSDYAAEGAAIYIAGDSTAAPGTDKRSGWGDYVKDYFTSDIKVVNKAQGGASSKSFYNSGRWSNGKDGIIDTLKSGDYVLIQFGHNDQVKNNAYNADTNTFVADKLLEYNEKYGANETVSYEGWLKKMTDEVRAKGATPIILSSVTRRAYWDDINLSSTPSPPEEYLKAALKTAADEGLKSIDVYQWTYELIKKLGAQDSKLIYAEGDTSHFNELGARITASHVAREIGGMGENISNYTDKSSLIDEENLLDYIKNN